MHLFTLGLSLFNPQTIAFLLGYYTIIPYTKFEQFGIIRF